MNIPVMNYLLLLIPFCISLGVLALMLLRRENQHQQIEKGLIDRLLVSQGHNPLPEIEPLADLGAEGRKADLAEKIEETIQKIRRARSQPSSVRFAIPNMAQPKSGMGEVKRG